MNTLKTENAMHIKIGSRTAGVALENEYAIDSFERISDIAYLWKRKTFAPVKQMKMHLVVPGTATLTAIPPSARSKIKMPLCTYTETKDTTIALLAAHERDAEDCSCLSFSQDLRQNHIIIWPKEDISETPYDYLEQLTCKERETKSTFEAIIVAYEAENTKKRYERLLEFARGYYAKDKVEI